MPPRDPPPTRRPAAALLALATLCGIPLAALLAGRSGTPTSSTTAPAAVTTHAPPTAAPATRLDPALAVATPAGSAVARGRLVDAGWDAMAADAVVGILGGWLDAVREDDPALFDFQVNRLAGIEHAGRLADFLRRRPEAAPLLAAADDPDALTALLDADDEDYFLLAGVFVRHCEPADVRDAAALLAENRGAVLGLLRRGVVAPECLFAFDRRTPEGAAYAAWLRREAAARLSASDDDLADFVQFAAEARDDLLRRLRDDAFRSRFVNSWDRLCRVCSRGGSPVAFADEPGVWDVLARPDGERLLAAHGPAAVRLLAGPDAYPESLRPAVAGLLLRDDPDVVRAAVRFRPESAFRRILGKPLPDERLHSVCRLLMEADERGESAGMLRELAGKTPEQIGRVFVKPRDGVETFLPFYDAASLGDKLAHGDDVSAADVAWAVVDFVPVPAGKAVVIVGKGGKALGTRALKAAEKAALEDAVSAVARRAGGPAAARVGAGGLTRFAGRFAVAGRLARTHRAVRELPAAVNPYTSLDVTEAVRQAYRASRLPPPAFKFLTGLDPRIFMRKDRRVFVRCEVVGDRAARCMLDHMRRVDRASGGPPAPGTDGPARPAPDVPAAAPAAGGGGGTPDADDRLWRENVAWWWLNAGNPARPSDGGTP